MLNIIRAEARQREERELARLRDQREVALDATVDCTQHVLEPAVDGGGPGLDTIDDRTTAASVPKVPSVVALAPYVAGQLSPALRPGVPGAATPALRALGTPSMLSPAPLSHREGLVDMGAPKAPGPSGSLKSPTHRPAPSTPFTPLVNPFTLSLPPQLLAATPVVGPVPSAPTQTGHSSGATAGAPSHEDGPPRHYHVDVPPLSIGTGGQFAASPSPFLLGSARPGTGRATGRAGEGEGGPSGTLPPGAGAPSPFAPTQRARRKVSAIPVTPRLLGDGAAVLPGPTPRTTTAVKGPVFFGPSTTFGEGEWASPAPSVAGTPMLSPRPAHTATNDPPRLEAAAASAVVGEAGSGAGGGGGGGLSRAGSSATLTFGIRSIKSLGLLMSEIKAQVRLLKRADVPTGAPCSHSNTPSPSPSLAHLPH